MTLDSMIRGIRAKKEDYILQVVKGEGKIKTTELFGTFSRKYPGSSIRTFLNEYLEALEYRRDVITHVEAQGYFVYDPRVFEQEQLKKEIPR